MRKTKQLPYLCILFFEKYTYQRQKFVKAYAVKKYINKVIKQPKKKIKKGFGITFKVKDENKNVVFYQSGKVNLRK